MKRFVAVIGGAVIAAGVAVSAFAHDGAHKEGAEAKAVTVQGELIDTACFISSEGDAKGQDHAQCASECLGSGIPAGILPEGGKTADMMFLLTNPKPFAQYAGKTIKVEGEQHGHMHAIDPKKLFVKDGSGWKEIQLDDAHHKMGEAEGEKKPADSQKKDDHAAHKH